ncbi:hypothetical protein [Actinomyces vulturis]|uniref:hypothetical protein n=1 Tax=Actinomyces vulturis TaxID=1857645 RepID=UPI00082EC775|nr:hypothetical protein [Actinomyces vulturis]
MHEIYDLTGSPREDVGPGSTEKKSVLLSVVRACDIDANVSSTKHELVRIICDHFGIAWSNEFVSRGQTVTAKALSAILLALRSWSAQQQEQGIVRASYGERVHAEATMILQCLASELSTSWDGRQCIAQMYREGSSQWRQTEWPGFFFEHKALPILQALPGSRDVMIDNTHFDYARQLVWDLKTHAESIDDMPLGMQWSEELSDGIFTAPTPLNDQGAMRQCVTDYQGIGFIVLNGLAVFKAHESFKAWRKAFVADPQRQITDPVPALRVKSTSLSGRSRKLKVHFIPTVLEAFAFVGEDSFARAQELGVLTTFHQGRQQSGAVREPKFNLHMGRARQHGFRVATHQLMDPHVALDTVNQASPIVILGENVSHPDDLFSTFQSSNHNA